MRRFRNDIDESYFQENCEFRKFHEFQTTKAIIVFESDDDSIGLYIPAFQIEDLKKMMMEILNLKMIDGEIDMNALMGLIVQWTHEHFRKLKALLKCFPYINQSVLAHHINRVNNFLVNK